MKLTRATFDGSLLQRGFWLYVWRVRQGDRAVLYVGRTGDSSSQFAGSPFSRLGQHLDVRPNAKANTLLRNLRTAGIDPEQAAFELFSVGPLFPEQKTMELHRKHRDIIGPVEAALAAALRDEGHHVIGKHQGARSHDTALLQKVFALLGGQLSGR